METYGEREDEMEQINKAQFSELVETHQLSMFRLAKSLLNNEDDAEDAVSSAILKAYDGRNTIRDVKNFKSWILKIVSNEAYSIFRKKKKIVYMDNMSEVVEETQHTNEPEINYDVWDAVQRLDEKFRAIVVLHYYDDLSIKVISEILDLNQNTVKVRLYRARQQLKSDLMEQEGLNNE